MVSCILLLSWELMMVKKTSFPPRPACEAPLCRGGAWPQSRPPGRAFNQHKHLVGEIFYDHSQRGKIFFLIKILHHLVRYCYRAGFHNSVVVLRKLHTTTLPPWSIKNENKKRQNQTANSVPLRLSKALHECEINTTTLKLNYQLRVLPKNIARIANAVQVTLSL